MDRYKWKFGVHTECLVAECDGILLCCHSREELWARYSTDAPRPRTPSHSGTKHLVPPTCRCWTHALELLCRAKGPTDLLDKPSVRDKYRRNLAEPSPSRPIDTTAGPVFNVFFPEGAFYKIDLEKSQVQQ